MSSIYIEKFFNEDKYKRALLIEKKGNVLPAWTFTMKDVERTVEKNKSKLIVNNLMLDYISKIGIDPIDDKIGEMFQEKFLKK